MTLNFQSSSGGATTSLVELVHLQFWPLTTDIYIKTMLVISYWWYKTHWRKRTQDGKNDFVLGSGYFPFVPASILWANSEQEFKLASYHFKITCTRTNALLMHTWCDQMIIYSICYQNVWLDLSEGNCFGFSNKSVGHVVCGYLLLSFSVSIIIFFVLNYWAFLFLFGQTSFVILLSCE